jgi:hypothetical protein
MEAAKIYFIAFGVLTITGGIVGYVKAGSMASIIAGSITGILLLVAAFLLPQHRRAVCSQIHTNRENHACRDDGDPECDRARRCDCRLGQKVIAWEEFVCGRGGGWCW